MGFIKGRLLCENVLLASEMVTGFHKRGPTTRGCLQIDLMKAYDNLNWEFMLNILTAFGLPEVFINWIKECITSTSFSIAFNGELLDCFPGRKGLRQGDPISSLLFFMAMDILSKLLDKGAVENRFGLHPLGDAPLITHISFADDVLLFFDGTDRSLQGLLEILESFNNWSGLGINRSKTAVFFDGGDRVRNRTSAAAHGLAQGSFPVRYLGVPLTTKKLRKQDYQPLLDKIHSRFTSWTVKHLSFAGRLQLLKSVIYSTISFWASIFLLPNGCLRALEQMCNSFLWKGVPTGARGAKVAWDVVCSATKAGGLGLRKLSPWNRVMGLKLIWLLFTVSGSLGVSWARRHLIGGDNFWTLDASNSGSWIWKSLCKLRHLARPFVVCEVNSGITASFWHDNWSSLGSLLHLTGDQGPRVSGLAEDAVVRDALVNNDWWVNRFRSRNPIISLLRNCLPSPQEIVVSEEDDRYLWKVGDGLPVSTFSASSVWDHLHDRLPEVDWHKSVWFKGRIPKHAFMMWLIALNRLSTRGRMRNWGLNVPPSCVLCGSAVESHQHIFSDCAYGREVWSFFFSAVGLTPPPLVLDVFRWILAPTPHRNINIILKIAYQASLYMIWKERNSRIHSQVSRPAASFIQEVQRQLRAKMDILSREQRNLPSTVTFLSTWRRHFDRQI